MFSQVRAAQQVLGNIMWKSIDKKGRAWPTQPATQSRIVQRKSSVTHVVDVLRHRADCRMWHACVVLMRDWKMIVMYLVGVR
jgi:hypothetical protein